MDQFQIKIEQVFRQEARVINSALTRFFGPSNLDLIEQVSQEAYIKAIQEWPKTGVPDNPTAWMIQVAKNLALDFIRREKSFKEKESEIQVWMTDSEFESAQEKKKFTNEIENDELRMMFVCCHPLLPEESQITLILNTLCGLGIPEISRAFFLTQETVAKRLVRARQKLREEEIKFDLPSLQDVKSRLDSVLRALYLVFSEGYNSHSGDELIREELCQNAMTLTDLLEHHPLTSSFEVHALKALMLFQASRFKARINSDGAIVILAKQERSTWNKTMISEGMRHLGLSMGGEEMSEYHLEAAISACHTRARTYDDTGWELIVSFYDKLISLHPSPIIRFNRAVAVGMKEGPQQGITELDRLKKQIELQNHHLFYASLGEFQSRLGNNKQAVIEYRKALSLAHTGPEIRFLQQAIVSLENLNH
jgi:RNA polymerase sigma factor (sigma-70 family)